MYLFRHVEEEPLVSDELPAYPDLFCDGEVIGADDQPPASNADCGEGMIDWFASDEAAFWMSL